MYVTINEKNIFYIFEDSLLDIRTLQQNADIYFENRKELEKFNDSNNSGRSQNIIIKYNAKKFIVREYYHGGLLGELFKTNYIYPGRFVYEFINLKLALNNNINTIEPAALIIKKNGFLYKGILITKFLENSTNLAEYFLINRKYLEDDKFRHKVMESIAKEIADFHNHGFFHPDLQLKNVLVKGTDIVKSHIIDFDKVRKYNELSLKLRALNLLRFNRSIKKFNLKIKYFNLADEINFLNYYLKWCNIDKNKFMDTFEFYEKLIRIKWSISDLINYYLHPQKSEKFNLSSSIEE